MDSINKLMENKLRWLGHVLKLKEDKRDRYSKIREYMLKGRKKKKAENEVRNVMESDMW